MYQGEYDRGAGQTAQTGHDIRRRRLAYQAVKEPGGTIMTAKKRLALRSINHDIAAILHADIEGGTYTLRLSTLLLKMAAFVLTYSEKDMKNKT